MDVNTLFSNILKVEQERHGIDWMKFYAGEDLQEEAVNKRLQALGLSITAQDLASGNDVQDVPNIFITNRPGNHYINHVQGLRGEDIEKYISKTISNLQIAENTIYDDLEAAAFGLAIAGIGGLALTWMGLTGIGLSFGWGIVGSSVAAAVQMGAFACGTLIGVVIVAVIGAFFAILNKDAQVLTLILNRTSANLNITEKYFESGKLLSEPEQLISVDTGYKCSISRAYKTGPYEMVNAGWLNVTKKTGTYGVSGAIQINFEEPSPFDKNIYLAFEIPFNHWWYLNGCDISLADYSSAKSYYKDNRSSFTTGSGIERDEGDGRLIQIYQADNEASSNYMISVIQAPLTD